MLYIELDKADPIIEDLLPFVSHKMPKLVAATLNALTAIYHAYGVKIVDPKPVLKMLPKAFGHADKNVRAEASNLAVELYRWLREAMKTLFWNELKPMQQQDLEKLFEGVKQEPPPKQDRLLRSQQAAKVVQAVDDEAAEEQQDEADAAEVDAIDLAEPMEILSKVPKDFNENMASAKWKDRKEALDTLFATANVDRIKDGPFDDVIQALAKSMKDANMAVVLIAVQCVDVLAKGLRKPFAKYRSRIMAPMMEKLKEKKQAVADAIGSALDSVFTITSLSECLEDILEFLKHKNPQVKAETLKFLIRCLKTTREAPSKPETKSMADAATKLLTESTEAARAGGAEVLGTLMKIMGERAMNPYLEGLDDIRKTKIKEYHDAAVVKAKDKPKPVAPPPKAAAPTQKRPAAKKAAPGLKKPAPRPITPTEEPPQPAARPTGPKSIPSKLNNSSKPGLKAPSKFGSLKPPSTLQSPRRNITPPSDSDPTPAPKPPRSLANRPLGKPTPLSTSSSPPTTTPDPGLSAAERADLDALRFEKDSAQRTIDDLLSSKSRLAAEIHELQNQNAQLIEDHTRDVLSIKAKETQLVRARGDAEAAEQTVRKQTRELERLRREVGRAQAEDGGGGGSIYRDSEGRSEPPPHDDVKMSREVGFQRAREYMTSPSEEKENGGLEVGAEKMRSGSPARTAGTASSVPGGGGDGGGGTSREPSGGAGGRPQPGGPVEISRRAAEVTSQLKARIEMMKVGFRLLCSDGGGWRRDANGGGVRQAKQVPRPH